ncbi:hypothetical protein CKAH01_19110, partial [Colletotrichum kahawae]
WIRRSRISVTAPAKPEISARL